LTWLGLLLAFALVVAACGDDDAADTTAAPGTTEAPTTTEAATTTAAPESTTTTEAAPEGKPYGGEVIVADAQEPPTLNPKVPGGTNFIVAVIGQGHLVGVQNLNGNTLEFDPDVVEELPTTENGGVVINDDGTMTVSYTIKDEAVWADGTPISGDDFLFTWELHMDPDLPTSKSAPPYDKILGDSIEVGDKTFVFTMDSPTVQYELLFDSIVPAHQVRGTDFVNDWNDTAWVAGGPFMVDTWQKGEFLKLVRNDNYWGTDPETGQQLPYLDSVVFRFIPETTSLLNAFAAREVHVINPDPAPNVIERLQGLVSEGAQVEALAGTIWEHLLFSFHAEARLERNPDSSTDQLKFRQAVAHLLDKDLIVDEILLGQVEPLTSYVDVFIPRLSTNAWDEKYPYNPEGAAALIDELCADLGRDCDANPITAVFTTTSNNEARVTLSELFVDMFAAAGIDYTADLEDSSLFFGESAPNGVMDVAEWAWLSSPGIAGLVSIHDVWDPENPGPGGDNWYYWGTEFAAYQNDATARFAALRDEMNATVDPAELEALIAEAQDILSDEVVFVPLYARLSVGAAWGDTVGGFKHNPTSAGMTWNMGEWYRVDLG
jgi:peptide/nickel transport system substrate-binding protein